MPYAAAAQLRGCRKSGLPTGLVPTDATSVFRSILTAHQRQHRQLEHLIFGHGFCPGVGLRMLATGL